MWKESSTLKPTLSGRKHTLCYAHWHLFSATAFNIHPGRTGSSCLHTALKKCCCVCRDHFGTLLSRESIVASSSLLLTSLFSTIRYHYDDMGNNGSAKTICKEKRRESRGERKDYICSIFRFYIQ